MFLNCRLPTLEGGACVAEGLPMGSDDIVWRIWAALYSGVEDVMECEWGV